MLGLYRCLIILWQQFSDATHGMIVDSMEDILQPLERIDAMRLASALQTVQHGRSLSGIVTAREHKVLPADRNGTDQMLHLVIVNVE